MAASHAEAKLSPAGSAVAGGAASSAPSAVDSGLIKGRAIAVDYERVLVVRLRDLRLGGDDSPFATPGASIAEAAAKAVASFLKATPKVPGATPRELADDIFGSADCEAPSTLWLLDGFDEVPRARPVAAALMNDATAAFDEARARCLTSPSAAPAEVEFRALPAAGVAPADRLGATLRVLLTQQNVVISSRPEFEGDLAPLTGRKSPLYLRLGPLPTQSVVKFVDGALKVSYDRGSFASPFFALVDHAHMFSRVTSQVYCESSAACTTHFCLTRCGRPFCYWYAKESFAIILC